MEKHPEYLSSKLAAYKAINCDLAKRVTTLEKKLAKVHRKKIEDQRQVRLTNCLRIERLNKIFSLCVQLTIGAESRQTLSQTLARHCYCWRRSAWIQINNVICFCQSWHEP